jgi:putative ABC transport system permease protein
MSVLCDLRSTFRQIRRTPGFLAIAVAVLALGIGANTAIFSAVEAVLLRPLPYSDPNRLVIVWEDASFVGFAQNTPAPANYVDWRAQNQVFTDMAATRYASARVTGDGPPEQLVGKKTTPNFFDVLGVQPMLGRAYTSDEDKARSAVVVISHELWQRRFGGDPAVLGKEISLNMVLTRIIGVMPKGFFFHEREAEYWVPFAASAEDWARRGSHFLKVVARMKPGVTLERARLDMDRVAKNLQLQYPDTNAKIGAVVVPMQIDFAGDARSGLWVLQISSVFILLIACSNLANLLLARSTGRRREIALRVALGASVRQIASQLLTESLIIAVAGGGIGLWLGQMCWKVFGNLLPSQVGGQTFQVNSHVMLFTAGISIAAGILFGLAPALRSKDVVLYDSLKEGARAGESRGGLRLRDALVVAQFALAFALLAGAGLMIQTIWNLRKTDLGFRADHLLTMRVPLPSRKYDTDEKRREFFRQTVENVRALPGVKSAGFASDAPFTTEGDTNAYFVEGDPPLAPGEMNDALYREVTPGYLETIGAILRDGRTFDSGDRDGGAQVIVVNEFLAKRHWPGQNGIGKRLRFDNPDEGWRTVVGVVADIRERGLLLDMKPAIYVPSMQVREPDSNSYLVVRTANDPSTVIKAVQTAILSADPQQPTTLIRTMDQLMEIDVADRTRPMILLGAFAGLALVLACLGVYGVLAYSVAQRTREIGVRMALGARSSDVTAMILGRGLKLSALGLLAGAALAIALSFLLRSLLYGVTPAAPFVYASAAGSLVLVAAAACVIPAQRASRVDPIVALRDE